MGAAVGGAVLHCGDRPLTLDRPRVMGVLNITPDSFSDGGSYLDLDRARAHARQMVAEGADLIDVGGESSRPGAPPVPLDQELERVIPVVEALVREVDCPISVDTYKPAVARAAVAAGAGLINDIRALQEPGALEAAAGLGVPVCLMHMQGQPQTMQESPSYHDVVAEVGEFLAERVAAAEAAGLPRERIVLDPGFGFGKTLAHNYQLLRHLERIVALGLPVLVGMSRKSMVGKLLDRPVEERLAGSLGAAAVAVFQGARIIRAHDVGPTADAVRVAAAAATAQESR
ncbi:dihydropteroate synthase [Halorhodospira halophila]|uniref:Dihydropteroate synthase n=1 Tax=Halorhodospira halophila (strain DSM 244 / SL1) TaxID=349124 RepID=A1WXX1_HALHL|nr:dihydropteroate synthase [Halorhodospira halophila]ABM62533.1 Dihydropteroate synthase [Halorhodospira halophila SL1]MBK1728210.1 dihydropteroate synthase [Halorhodospira halophila]